MSESLKLSARTKDDPEAAFLDSLENVSDIIAALSTTCGSIQELLDTVDAARQVPGVLRLTMDKVKTHLTAQKR